MPKKKLPNELLDQLIKDTDTSKICSRTLWEALFRGC